MEGVSFTRKVYLLICLSLIWTCSFATSTEPAGAELGEECTTSTNCTTLHPHSTCSETTHVCVCSSPYTEKDKKCAAPFNYDCKIDKSCFNDVTNECTPDKLSNYKCRCKKGYQEIKKVCKGPLGVNCLKKEDCSNYLSYCSDEGICKCRNGLKTIMDEDRCTADYNNFCTFTGGGCSTPNAICKVVNSTQRCLCPKNRNYNPEKGECPAGGGTTSICSTISLVFICILMVLLA